MCLIFYQFVLCLFEEINLSYVFSLFFDVSFNFGSGPQGLVVRDGYVKATKAAGTRVENGGNVLTSTLGTAFFWRHGDMVCSGQHQGMDLPLAKTGLLILSAVICHINHIMLLLNSSTLNVNDSTTSIALWSFCKSRCQWLQGRCVGELFYQCCMWGYRPCMSVGHETFSHLVQKKSQI